MLFVFLLIGFFLVVQFKSRRNIQSLCIIGPEQAIRYVGRNVQIRGLIFDVTTSADGDIVLCFGDKYPKQTFSARIPAGSPLAGEDWITSLRGQIVRILGVVAPVDGAPAIEVLSMEQIVGAYAGFAID